AARAASRLSKWERTRKHRKPSANSTSSRWKDARWSSTKRVRSRRAASAAAGAVAAAIGAAAVVVAAGASTTATSAVDDEKNRGGSGEHRTIVKHTKGSATNADPLFFQLIRR